MEAPVRFAPCWSPQNPKAAILDAQGHVVAFAAASTAKMAEENASYITAALNHYIADHPVCESGQPDSAAVSSRRRP